MAAPEGNHPLSALLTFPSYIRNMLPTYSWYFSLLIEFDAILNWKHWLGYILLQNVTNWWNRKLSKFSIRRYHLQNLHKPLKLKGFIYGTPYWKCRKSLKIEGFYRVPPYWKCRISLKIDDFLQCISLLKISKTS